MQPIPVPPIADPNAKPQRHFEGAEVREFRPRFWLYFLSNWMGGLAFGAFLLLVVASVDSWQLRHVAFGGARIAECAGIFGRFDAVDDRALHLAFYAAQSRALGTARRHVLDDASGSRVVADVARAHYLWFVFPYAIISCVGQPKLWVWLALETPREFAASVAAFTAPDHPLHAFLARRGLVDSIEPTD